MPDRSGYKSAMVVTAHADDAEWGCSGTVAKWCKQGWEVTYVLCTDGSKCNDDPNITSEILVETRKAEQLQAAEVLGLKEVVFLGYEDSILEPSIALRKDITVQIRKHKPDILICMYPMRKLTGNGYIGHPDHIASGEAAMAAVFPTARDRLTFPDLLEQGLEPHKVKELWVMGSELAEEYVDVTETIEIAIQALQKHASQIQNMEDVANHMREWRTKNGESVNMRYAEKFHAFDLS